MRQVDLLKSRAYGRPMANIDIPGPRALLPVRVLVILLAGESLPDASRCSVSVVLVRSDSGPAAPTLTLPGAYLDSDETLEEAAGRALDRVGVERPYFFRQLDARRTPEAVLVTYIAAVDELSQRPGAVGLALTPVEALGAGAVASLGVPGEEVRILEDALRTLPHRLEDSHLALHLVPEVFTLGQIRSVFEALQRRRLDSRNFRRKLLEPSRPLIAPVGETFSDRGSRGRPPTLYRATADWTGAEGTPRLSG